MRRILIPLIFGIAGVAVLVSLGVWQVQRLAWKEGVLAEIETRIAAEPVPIPAVPDPERDKYLPVEVYGGLTNSLRVLVSRKNIGAGYRVISGLQTRGGAVLLDRGFAKDWPEDAIPPAVMVHVKGNLHWPDDRNSSTPDNDVEGNIWFARDIAQMAEVLNTRPILVVAREVTPTVSDLTPLPVDTSSIPNDHLSYAITWFSLAAIWAIMTITYLWRQRAPRIKA